MKFASILYIFCIYIFTSCADNAASETVDLTNSQSPTFVPGDTTSKIVPTNKTDPEKVTATSNSQIQVSTDSANKKGLNPAHGQPGHRCDIAVGAPLNSKPQATSQSDTTLPTVPVAIVPKVDTGSVAQGLNPKHGEPGHRCDIAVGAPLNSKSTITTKPVVPTVSTTQQNTASEQKIAEDVTYPAIPKDPAEKLKGQSSVPPVSGTGLNPKHGQPGHRCDIAVGAPLNSKPVSPAKQEPKQ